MQQRQDRRGIGGRPRAESGTVRLQVRMPAELVDRIATHRGPCSDDGPRAGLERLASGSQASDAVGGGGPRPGTPV